MIGHAEYQQILANFPALHALPADLADQARSQFEPGDQVQHACMVHVRDSLAAIAITPRHIFAFWHTTMLFKKMPTIQQFHRSQLKVVEPSGLLLRLRSEASSSDYEESTFAFATPSELAQFLGILDGSIAPPAPAPAPAPAPVYASAQAQDAYAPPQQVGYAAPAAAQYSHAAAYAAVGAPAPAMLSVLATDGVRYRARLLEDRGAWCLLGFENGSSAWFERSRISAA